MTQSDCLIFLVDFSIGRSIDPLYARHRPSSPPFITLIWLVAAVDTHAVILILAQELFHGLLPNAIVTEVIELFQFVCKLALLHLLIHLCYQVKECLLYI